MTDRVHHGPAWRDLAKWAAATGVAFAVLFCFVTLLYAESDLNIFAGAKDGWHLVSRYWFVFLGPCCMLGYMFLIAMAKRPY